MTRPRFFCVCACLTLSLTAAACGSSNSGAALPTGWDQARIGNTGVGWWVNAIKSAYFFWVKITPAAQDDTTGRSTVLSFTQKVVGGLKSGSPAPATLVPAADQNSVWTLDQGNALTKDGVAVATDQGTAVNLVDGGADPFYTSSYQAKGMAYEVYTNGTYSLDLRVWQMASAKDATQVYGDSITVNIPNYEVFRGVTTWTTCSGSDPNNPCPAQ